jgi:hypothetical protein
MLEFPMNYIEWFAPTTPFPEMYLCKLSAPLSAGIGVKTEEVLADASYFLHGKVRGEANIESLS